MSKLEREEQELKALKELVKLKEAEIKKLKRNKNCTVTSDEISDSIARSRAKRERRRKDYQGWLVEEVFNYYNTKTNDLFRLYYGLECGVNQGFRLKELASGKYIYISAAFGRKKVIAAIKAQENWFRNLLKNNSHVRNQLLAQRAFSHDMLNLTIGLLRLNNPTNFTVWPKKLAYDGNDFSIFRTGRTANSNGIERPIFQVEMTSQLFKRDNHFLTTKNHIETTRPHKAIKIITNEFNVLKSYLSDEGKATLLGLDNKGHHDGIQCVDAPPI